MSADSGTATLEAHGQKEYQVRFDWGIAGLRAIAPDVDAVVIVDVLTFGTAVELAVAGGDQVPLAPVPLAQVTDAAGSTVPESGTAGGARDSGEPGGTGGTGDLADSSAVAAEALAGALAAGDRLALVAGFRNRGAVAAYLREQQAKKDGRYVIAIVAAGEERSDGSTRFTLEDQLAAGALVDALAELGIDYHSPEAAVACAGFLSLRRAVGQLVRASASGRELVQQGRAAEVAAATQLDSSAVIPILGEFGFRDARS